MEKYILDKVNIWLGECYDDETKAEIRKMQAENENELIEAFYKDLEFGTGGLRGIMGAGTNRMNKYTVASATQGLANYLKKEFKNQEIKVAIAYDSRLNSRFFAEVTAEVFSANGIYVYIFTELRPTPELSFAIRQLKCQSGVVITASHNPKEYNGYKAYWNDGGQMVSPHDTNVIDEVEKIRSVKEVKFGKNEALIQWINDLIDIPYLEKIKNISRHPEIIQKHKHLKMVYTPLHGTGMTMVPKALKNIGFENVHIVAAQAVSDGNFPTVISPNPEEKATLKLAIEEAEKIKADLVLATDPDADRVGIAVRNTKGEMILFNGNMTASLLIYYLLKNTKLKPNHFIIKTIVTTELLKTIADKAHVKTYDVLTGFKYIADKILELEGKEEYIGGGEESYGFLIGDFVREKDAVSACAMIAEIAAWAAEQGETIYTILQKIYLEYGFYKEDLLSITKKGKTGLEDIQNMMKQYRENPPSVIAGQKVIVSRDYKLKIETNMKTGKKTTLTLPESNVLQFFMEDGSKVTVRPSGTEPKIKFYFGVVQKLSRIEDYDKVETLLIGKINCLKEDFAK